jgi:hypothetical protein
MGLVADDNTKPAVLQARNQFMPSGLVFWGWYWEKSWLIQDIPLWDTLFPDLP